MKRHAKLGAFMKKLGLVVLSVVVVLAGLAGSAFLGRHHLLRMYEGLPAFTSKPGDVREVMVEMADGVKLATTVRHPRGEGPFPAILIRSPYAFAAAVFQDTLCGRFVRYGYICIYQDTRGQGGSEGEWVPGRYEIPDGRDTISWLVAQDFHDGNIAMVGPSYLASVQWAAAAMGLPKEVKTLVPAVYATNNHGVMYQDGLLRHETFTAWASMMREGMRGDDVAGEQYDQAVRYRPHNKIDTEVFGEAMPWYQEMIEAEAFSHPFWHDPDNTMIRKTPSGMTIPVLMIGGWYDVFIGAQMDDWLNLATRDESRFVIGPWTHIGGGGEALETPDAGGGLFQWKIMLNWLDHHLKGKPLAYAPGVAAYDVRTGTWAERESWPPEGQIKTWHLDKAEASASCEGGVLSETAPDGLGSVSYDYDPENPAPTLGGAGMLAFILPGFNGAPPATHPQPGLCSRDDVLSFVGPELTAPLKIAGDISVTLKVSSSAPDTAFSAKLIEVMPDGEAVNIRDSITTLKFRNGAHSPQDYQPGEEVEVTIDFWPIEWTVQPGSRLRLDISSSDFPKFHAHPNRSEPWAEVEETQIATQTLYTGDASRLELPVVN